MPIPPDFVCNVCGQSGLMLVELIEIDHKRCVLCQECEVIWEGEEPQESGPIIRFEEYMKGFGKEANWKKLVVLSEAGRGWQLLHPTHPNPEERP